MKKLACIAVALAGLAPALVAQGNTMANIGWYNGSWQKAVAGWSNAYSSGSNYFRVYDDFVVPEGGWTVTGAFSVNTLYGVGSVTEANWEIRSGVSYGYGGVLVASGTSPATDAVVDQAGGAIAHRIQVSGLNVYLPAGTYWLNVAPVVSLSSGASSPSYNCATLGASAVGSPAGNNGQAYFRSPGSYFTLVTSVGQNGFAADFSMGVLIQNGVTRSLDPSPYPASILGWFNGNTRQGIPARANWYGGLQQYSRVYDDFVVPAGGWTVTGVFSINAMSVSGVTQAAWEIRSGVSAGDPGSVVASGISAATQTVQEIWPDGERICRLTVEGLRMKLPAGTYWLSVAPVVSYRVNSGAPPPSYVSVTTGTNAIGSPQGNNGEAYWDSLVVPGSNFVKAKSTGGAGTSGDYSLGVFIANGAPAALNPTIGAVVNAASWLPGAVSPGEIVTVYGSGLGAATPSTLVLGPAGTASTALNGVRVFFGGVAAPQTYVSGNQINAVVPYEVAGQDSVPVVVVAGGEVSNAFPVAVENAAPALFTLDGSGAGQAAVLNQDYSGNAPERPASKGSYLSLFVTGVGLNSEPETGAITAVGSAAPWTPQPLLPVAVEIGGQAAEVSFNGDAPNMISGVMQVNVKIPASAPSGSAPIVVAVGGKRSPAGVTVSVR